MSIDSKSNNDAAADGRSRETITGSVDRVTYHNEQNGYTILRLSIPSHRDTVTVTGNFSSVTPGESLRLTGWWTTHPQYGEQFKSIDYSVVRPATIAGIQKYLGSGMIKGVGPVTAKRIVEHFGEQTLDIIETNLARLAEVHGIARKRIDMIQKAWAEQKAVKEVMLFLQSHAVSTHFAVKIFKQYGNDSITVVEKSPYRLASEVYGIGFRTADQIARNLGIAFDATERLEAGLSYVLQAATDEGHCYLPADELIRRASKVLEVEDQERIGSVLEKLLAEGLLVRESLPEPDLDQAEPVDAIFLPPIRQAEKSLAGRIRTLLGVPLNTDSQRVSRWLDRFTAKMGIELSDEQRTAILKASVERVMILTGGPGTGKTTTLKTMVALFVAMNKRVALASPTGRAAQRLSDVAGREARTIHRLLEFDPSVMAFKRNEQSPLDADVIIIDEASMIDILLANSLVKAVPRGSQLILVGDVDQLPSVGPGTVLKDMIASGSVPVARLNQVFRQAAESLIVQNAHRINQGEFPRLVTPGESKSDCYFIEAEDPDEVVELVVKLVSSSLPKSFGYDSRRDIQVLTPMNRGRIGTGNLNQVLQSVLNPPSERKPELTRGSRILRSGDKVIQRVNNYKLEVFNGDVGTIEAIDLEDQMVAVRFADRIVAYDYADILELGHGFCVTVHKSQGSEYPAVVLPLHMQHYLMLSRNLLYTALTRAKKTVVLVGTKKAIGAAMNNTEAGTRFTGLKCEMGS
ncbi:MAG: ATP-dependent RecD-like DNA helicase [Acidobacteria bacterium]|nr:ATP-dependent RecD-like DNA helicase [Acidobacteriota bacterium]